MKRERDIGFAVRRLSNLIKRDVERNKPNWGLEPITEVNGRAIGYFFDNRNKDIFQKDFETRFSIRPSTASNILKSMEQKGFIERISVENDARLKKIVLTDKAVELHQNVIKSIERREERLRQGISPEDLSVFFSVMEKLSANMEDKND